jgi:hypothetical protein
MTFKLLKSELHQFIQNLCITKNIFKNLKIIEIIFKKKSGRLKNYNANSTFVNFLQVSSFVQLSFNLSNGETDTLESSSILIYFQTRMGLYTQEGG